MHPSRTLADLVEIFRVPPATVVGWLVELGYSLRFHSGKYLVPEDAVNELLEKHPPAESGTHQNWLERRAE